MVNWQHTLSKVGATTLVSKQHLCQEQRAGAPPCAPCSSGLHSHPRSNPRTSTFRTFITSRLSHALSPPCGNICTMKCKQNCAPPLFCHQLHHPPFAGGSHTGPHIKPYFSYHSSHPSHLRMPRGTIPYGFFGAGATLSPVG